MDILHLAAPCRNVPVTFTLDRLSMLPNFLLNRPSDWWFNEVGIVLQLVGAGFLVVAGFKTRTALKAIPDSWEANLSEKLRDALAEQAFTGLYGFIFLAGGLLSQAVAGVLQK